MKNREKDLEIIRNTQEAQPAGENVQPMQPTDQELAERCETLLRRYKAGKQQLEDRIVENERWYRQRHGAVARNPGDPEPASAWLFNALANKHADAMDSLPALTVLPREAGDKPCAEVLEKAGVELISPQFANTNVDLPALPAESYRLVQDKSIYGIMDIGGDDRGAYALGRFTPFIQEENNYRMAREMAAWKRKVSAAWDDVKILNVHRVELDNEAIFVDKKYLYEVTLNIANLKLYDAHKPIKQ